jgi:hypothetical protein
MGCTVAIAVKDSISPKELDPEQALMFEGKTDGENTTILNINKATADAKLTELGA